MAQDGIPPARMTRAANAGIEHGTYTWNPATGVLTSSQNAGAVRRYQRQNGGCRTSAPMTFKVSADGLTLAIFVDGEADAVARVGAASTPAAANYQGLWWKSDEPYWGVNFAHSGRPGLRDLVHL